MSDKAFLDKFLARVKRMLTATTPSGVLRRTTMEEVEPGVFKVRIETSLSELPDIHDVLHGFAFDVEPMEVDGRFFIRDFIDGNPYFSVHPEEGRANTQYVEFTPEPDLPADGEIETIQDRMAQEAA